MLDIAREQAPTYEHLRQYLQLTQDSGYNAIGLYLEHRFVYPSAPWAAGIGAITPEMAKNLQAEFPEIQIIPFINLLGHFEGMLYTEFGKQFHEERFKGMQACPSNTDFGEFCERLIDDICSIFQSEIIHIGGDETQQLAKCEICSKRYANDPEQKAEIYGYHFGRLAHYLVEKKGRRAAVWGDMYLEHPAALEFMPKNSLIFNWEYFDDPTETNQQFLDQGFEVVTSPTLQTYNATWCHVSESGRNINMHLQSAVEQELFGVCLTTWECGLFGAYDTLFPAIACAGKAMNSGEPCRLLSSYGDDDEWATLMSDGLAECRGSFTPGKIRSSLKVRLLLYSNPFLAWMYHGEEFSGDVGERTLATLEKALREAKSEAQKGVTLFARSAVEFVRIAEQARLEYADGNAEKCVTKLATTRQIFDDLAKIAKRTNERIGGSLADIERCRIAKEHVEKVIHRIRHYGDGSLGYLPAFEHITHPKFVPHDQAAWWLINGWANE